MANIKISDLVTTSSVADTDNLIVNNATGTKKTTVKDVRGVTKSLYSDPTNGFELLKCGNVYHCNFNSTPLSMNTIYGIVKPHILSLGAYSVVYGYNQSTFSGEPMIMRLYATGKDLVRTSDWTRIDDDDTTYELHGSIWWTN